MRRRMRYGLGVGVTGIVLGVAACAASTATQDIVQGTWNCTAVFGDDSSGSAKVTVKDGTYQLTGPDVNDSGTWKLSGDTVTITSDSLGGFKLLGVPADAGKSMSIKLSGDGDEAAGLNASYADGTIRFSIDEAKYTCNKEGDA